MHTNQHEFDKLIQDVIGAAYEVANVLGCGFLERVYERALID
jgi:GxxExxY protein